MASSSAILVGFDYSGRPRPLIVDAAHRYRLTGVVPALAAAGTRLWLSVGRGIPAGFPGAIPLASGTYLRETVEPGDSLFVAWDGVSPQAVPSLALRLAILPCEECHPGRAGYHGSGNPTVRGLENLLDAPGTPTGRPRLEWGSLFDLAGAAEALAAL